MPDTRSSASVVRLVLMASSLVLLVLLQAFWLLSSYEQSFAGFHRETSALLRSTVFSLRDSVFLSDVDHLLRDELTAKGDTGEASPDRARNFTLLRRGENVRVAIRATGIPTDSTFGMPVLSRTADSVFRRENFIIRIRPNDTLSVEGLKKRYAKVIGQAGYNSTFLISHASRENFDSIAIDLLHPPPFEPDMRSGSRSKNTFGDTMITERVPIGPIHSYAAVFPGMRISILKKISPQIVFSGFLTAITGAAFFMMYSTLRSQERLMKMKNDFISNVTHELKTPIATVSVALEALRDFHALKNPERTSEYLGIAQHELNRLALMTDKILKASAFEHHGIVFTPGLVKVDDVVKQVVQSMTVVLEKKQITARVHSEGSRFEIDGSEMHITNVVYNLLDNAIKYSPSGTVISITLRETSSQVDLAVRDQGIGIDPSLHEQIFEKFFRVSSGNVHNTHGYGLGLNYVAEVVHSHRGTVRVDSAIGKGSCFTISFPKKNGN